MAAVLKDLNTMSLPKDTQDVSKATKTTTYTPPRTPTALSTSTHSLLAEIQHIYDALSTLPSLTPGEQTNTLLTRLVNLSITPESPEFVSNFFSINGAQSLCEKLRPLCSTAEGELERHWASKMLNEIESSPNADPSKVLSSFPYYKNYIDLSHLEASVLHPFLPLTTAPRKIAFIGSGPLPLTSLCILAHFPSATIFNIDRDASALALSNRLSDALGFADQMQFSCEDVSAATTLEWEMFDVVFLAALVGMDSVEKIGILEALVKKLRPGTVVVARSAHGLRSILYPVLELSNELARIGLEVLLEVHPWTEVVNSVVVMRVKEM